MEVGAAAGAVEDDVVAASSEKRLTPKLGFAGGAVVAAVGGAVTVVVVGAAATGVAGFVSLAAPAALPAAGVAPGRAPGVSLAAAPLVAEEAAAVVGVGFVVEEAGLAGAGAVAGAGATAAVGDGTAAAGDALSFVAAAARRRACCIQFGFEGALGVVGVAVADDDGRLGAASTAGRGAAASAWLKGHESPFMQPLGCESQ